MSNDDIVYNTAIADGMPRPLALLILAQARHESGDFTSSVFLDCNNAFGYNYVSSSCPGHDTYQNYNSLADSVHDLTGWIWRRYNEGNFPDLSTITTPGYYAQLLQQNDYYTDTVSNYTNGLLRWYDANFIPASIGISSIVLIIAGWLLFRHFKKTKNRKQVLPV